MSAAVGGTSLAMLVQQREMQNAKKLEALVLKNDELAEAYEHAEREREALLARLDELDAHTNELNQTAAAQDARMTYMEKGVEERFGVVEAAVGEMASHAVRDMVSEQVAKALRPVQEQFAQRCADLERLLLERDVTVTILKAQMGDVARYVGANGLMHRLRNTERAMRDAYVESFARSPAAKFTSINIHTEQYVASSEPSLEQERAEAQLQAMMSCKSDIVASHESVIQQLEALGDRLKSTAPVAPDAQTPPAAGTPHSPPAPQPAGPSLLDEIEALREATDRKLHEMSEEVTTALERVDAQKKTSYGVLEGRMNLQEGTICQLQGKLIESIESTGDFTQRLKNVESRVGAHEGRLTAADAALRSMDVQQKIIGEQLDEGRAAEAEKTARLEELITGLVQDIGVMEEKRRQRERDSDAGRQISELDRLDVQDIRQDIELLKDQHAASQTKAVDGATAEQLLAEMARARSVLDALIAQQQAKEDHATALLKQTETRLDVKVHTKMVELETYVRHVLSGAAAEPPSLPKPQDAPQPAAEGGTASEVTSVASGSPRPPPGSMVIDSAAAPPPSQHQDSHLSHLLPDLPSVSPALGEDRQTSPKRGSDLDNAHLFRAAATSMSHRPSAPHSFGSSSPERVVRESAVEVAAAAPAPVLRQPSLSLTPANPHSHGSTLSYPPPSAHASQHSRHSALASTPHSTGAGAQVSGVYEYGSASPAGSVDPTALLQQFNSVASQPPPPRSASSSAFVSPVDPALADAKALMEAKLQRSRAAMDERRRLEADLEKVNQQLSFIQVAFQTVSEKEGTLGESKHAFLSQLDVDGSDRAEGVKQKLLKMVDDIRRSKQNIYERERVLVDEGGKLRKNIGELREVEKVLAEEIHALQKTVAQGAAARGRTSPAATPYSAPPAYSRPSGAGHAPPVLQQSDAQPRSRTPQVR
eukprot:TRINITY_DN13833_c0_g1_i2.p1 TRINITY_DN13833_c0_g1~~TRINITY_DN13833_c0_g1_i2.p1  ORF type:complete len:936 (+),score=296.97 TRINITY_DN13833_c0_g1_i2:76-2883(+)